MVSVCTEIPTTCGYRALEMQVVQSEVCLGEKHTPDFKDLAQK